ALLFGFGQSGVLHQAQKFLETGGLTDLGCSWRLRRLLLSLGDDRLEGQGAERRGRKGQGKFFHEFHCADSGAAIGNSMMSMLVSLRAILMAWRTGRR